MVSNYSDKSLSVLSEGKRHYHNQKKTSLYGSESPNKDRGRVYQPRSGNNIFGSGEEQMLNQSNVKKPSYDQDKRETLEELKRYDPWGKPGAGAPNTNNSNNSNRAKWEYEQKMKEKPTNNENSNDSFPGFNTGFGSGNIINNGRKRSDMFKNNDAQQNNFYPYATSVENSTNAGSNSNGAPDANTNNQETDEIMQKKYQETKALADDLEKEIQRLKLQQLESKYATMQNEKNPNSEYEQEQEHAEDPNFDYRDDALSREAEYRARLRHLEKMKDSYDSEYQENNFNFNNNNNENAEKAQAVSSHDMANDRYFSNESRRSSASKSDSSINRNDYRPYTVEEYMNSRPQMVNPSLNKRTTLSGSEELRYNKYNSNGNNINSNMQIIDEDNIIRQFSKSNTHGNLFPSDRNYSPAKSASSYQTKAPYATD